jgi:hypothetical protein
MRLLGQSPSQDTKRFSAGYFPGPRPTGNIREYPVQVKVHFGQCLLHVLDVLGGVADQICSVSPVGAEHAHLVVGTPVARRLGPCYEAGTLTHVIEVLAAGPYAYQ